MNNKALNVLEFGKIKDEIAKYLITSRGKTLLKKLMPMSVESIVHRLIDQTKDGMDIVRLRGEIPVRKLDDLHDQANRLKKDGNLNGTELAAIGQVLKNTAELKAFFADLHDDEIPLRELFNLSGDLIDNPTLTHRIDKSIDDSGRLLDTASDDLQYIRNQINRYNEQIRHSMEQYTRGKNTKYLTEAIVTLRDDRFVVPVKTEYRAKFGGVVHDQSASGQTLYIEPQAVVGLNNQLHDAQTSEKLEEIRILGELSDLVRPEIDDIVANNEVLAQFDLINAKAKYANQIKATEPLISRDNIVDLKEAKHPLINPDKVVANDIKIGDDYRTMLITGPNTGGKTITMKTLGLIQIMAQSGLFIPAHEESQVAVFDEVFVDIGDEQSIEQNLSTFSSHMDNIINIMKHVTERSLVLIDELGAGTDPQEGAAIAIAILEKLSESNPEIMATTHYPELKIYAYNTDNTINASMEFDDKSLKPTYRLLIGIPGASNAMNIAARLGMDRSVIERGNSLMSGESQDLNNMINDLEKRRKEFEQNNEKLEAQLAKNKKLEEQYETERTTLENSKDSEIQAAKVRANQIVSSTKKKSEKIIDRLKDLERKGYAVKPDQIISARTDLKNLHQEDMKKKNRVLRRNQRRQELKVGDNVKAIPYGQFGTIIRKDQNNKYEVQLGILKMKFDAADLEKTQQQPEETDTKKTMVRRTKSSSLSSKLDLRGERYEEAMADLDTYIDEALLAGYNQVTIVHGFGTGVIRNGVTKYLQSNPRVKSFGYAPASSGGSGATIVDL
ncbi:endonuclease MutS2 [Companilactobacillus sp.]|jgi:DNA mismatch repair protein MutS2|uniref:endonuclease MutS2 n=1 Tax=Companilactobacillus sp. TaxID=2767905 RepID=UPI0025B9956E|nr:endonuclease MutS2 [Companilactobacillus sp.]MCH4010304.1 endonuclease MutS2 [Companilactobacillus sp.]MCH4052020.1 endonuclease MutS2 [Companilactobacillus sp.]MCH4078246.1 endonuclease MutS2 [Companilactobacillus sp.]MCH4126822.1 endonuclease MutS2 [Companilactobacillus sp.]MCH4132661.1 endonuclease MutS2 [Companilactobacillus sp.]